MQFIYDNLTASVIAGTVLLILFTIQMRAMSTSIAQTSRNIGLNRAQTFATWLEEDLQRFGRNRADDEEVISVLERVEEEQSPEKTLSPEKDVAFGFYFDSKSVADCESDPECSSTLVEYSIEASEQTIAGENRTVYQLTRTPDGQSPPDLGYIDIQFVDENAIVVNAPESNRSDIRAIRVHFSVLPPFQNDESELDEVHRMVVVPFTPSL